MQIKLFSEVNNDMIHHNESHMQLLWTVNSHLFKWARSQNYITNEQSAKCRKVHFFNLFNTISHYFASYKYKQKSRLLKFCFFNAVFLLHFF